MNGLTLARKILRAGYLMRDICEHFKITHRNSTAYRPQMNGAVEAANKNIKKILRKMTDNHRGWHETLPHALLGYRTAVRWLTGATSYLLVYGTEAVILTEVEIPLLRFIQEAELSNAGWVRKRIGQLTLIDEKRMVVVCMCFYTILTAAQYLQLRLARVDGRHVEHNDVGNQSKPSVFPSSDFVGNLFEDSYKEPAGFGPRGFEIDCGLENLDFALLLPLC
ncbi:uncharacterized protein LOC107027473 [Solanum pennellii]|uniref:Uncharacterized protein LOC107027473 n=1 Tax=Solanum pennellii TaxID=28526 RepID=A0ABM1HE03_SOLPN|nr:uncharacterized protein LOC107027473 [Solanum pennellii]